MRMTRPSVRGGNWFQHYYKQRLAKLESDFNELGGMFLYEAPQGPIDNASYDDPHKSAERTDLNKHLEGWEPL